MTLFEHFGRLNNFAKFAWFVVAYNILVIIWGAFVRASKSGAGCGNNYPLCDGSNLVPLNPTTATVIEFVHRASTGLDGIFVLAMVIWAFYAFSKRHKVRRVAVLSLVFILIEGAIGAGLVLFELVAENKSVARALYMSAHLVNTLILLLFLALTAWFASDDNPINWRDNQRRAALFGLGLFLMALVGMSGAVAALGNTLYPGHELSAALTQPDVTFLVKVFVWLELWHPFLSVATSIYLVGLIQPWRSMRFNKWTRKFANATLVLIGCQMIFGTLTLVFLAPVWMQLGHLLLAELMWITLVLLAASVMAEPKFALRANENFVRTTG